MTDITLLQKATTLTARDLTTVARSESMRGLSRLSLPEIDAVVDLVSKIVPAGNVPGIILSGLARLPGQRIPPQTLQQHVNALFSGVEQILDQVTFSTVFAGPAAVIWGYQNLLKLAGKDPDMAFPEGVWQFYVDYALREDTARHATETHGFDSLLQQHGIRLNEVDRWTSWVMAAISCIHQYDALLEVEWRERVSTSLLRGLTAHLPDSSQYAGLYREWEIQRPYRRGAEAATFDYPDYRKIKFDHFLQEAMRDLPANLRAEWAGQLQAAERDLFAYQRQMSILAYLEPGQYGETRVPYNFDQARIGLILRGEYYLLPVYTPGTDKILDVEIVRAQIAALLAQPGLSKVKLAELARVRRAVMPSLRRKLSQPLRDGLEQLRFAPILVNADRRPSDLPLTELRQAERGVGDHALTIFETANTFVFDQSHIFFDGILGAALAEIMTNEALSWAVYLNTLPEPEPAAQKLFAPLKFDFTDADRELIRRAPQVTPESGAETDKVNLKACANLRRLFMQRSQALNLTVNDLLVLYRAMHAARYQPSPKLAEELQLLAADKATHALAVEIATTIEKSRRQNPSMLIPMDASRRSPRDRLYPLSMEVPLVELDLLSLHRRAVHALEAYESASGERSAQHRAFDTAQRAYLAALAGLGIILDKLKEIAIQGESASVGAIKLLAHLPPVLQRLLDKVPARFELLNNMLKGQEVFSNVGAVVPSSTLKRFVTAKDDNEQKQLVWGIITDADSVMRISLRDFRPHVAGLHAIGRRDLARLITQDYLDAYAEGFNTFIHDLQRITVASRETRLAQAAPTVVMRKKL
jgi:hypothetical protein